MLRILLLALTRIRIPRFTVMRIWILPLNLMRIRILSLTFFQIWTLQCSKNDPLRLPSFHFDADVDPDPAFHFDVNPNPDQAFQFDADLDITFQNDADPDQHCVQPTKTADKIESAREQIFLQVYFKGKQTNALVSIC